MQDEDRAPVIAYLVNCYPAVSHSFIRREIAGLEALGIAVRRFSIQPAPAHLPEAEDRAEAERTICVLGQGIVRLLLATARVALTRPGRFLAALALAIRSAQGTPRLLPKRLAYLVEACWLAGQIGGVEHIHAHFGTNPAAVLRLLHRLTGLPYSFTAHGPEEYDSPQALDLAGKVADAKLAVAISDFGRSQLMRWSRFEDWGKLAIVRCGIDERFAAAPPAPPVERPALCCVARLSAQKGLPLLIEAAALLHRRGIAFTLTLVGDGEMRGEIERMIAAAGLGAIVTITGYLDAAGVRARLEASRAMVLPSFAEGLPVVIMEALALRTPVITTAIAGIPELVDATCGWLLPAGSVDKLVDAMTAALATDPRRLREMGEIGRARVLAMHDSRANAAILARALGLAPIA